MGDKIKESKIEEKSEKRKSKYRLRFNTFSIVVLISLLILLVISGYHVFYSIGQYKESFDTRDELISEYVSTPAIGTEIKTPNTTQSPSGINVNVPQIDPNGTEPPNEELEIPPISVDFENLIKLNPDIVGWIYVPGTGINYPIVQTNNNYFYMYHNVKKEQARSGCIMMDYKNSNDFSDRNTIIYGHLMNSETMFGELNHMTYDEEYLKSHLVAYILTPTKNYRIDFITVRTVPAATDPYYNIFVAKEDLTNYLKGLQSGSIYYNCEDPDAIEHIVTLSTCNKSFSGARLIVIGNIKEIYHE